MGTCIAPPSNHSTPPALSALQMTNGGRIPDSRGPKNSAAEAHTCSGASHVLSQFPPSERRIRAETREEPTQHGRGGPPDLGRKGACRVAR
eukprot:6173059-Pleurochrysis_carterae.AAC.2